MVSRIRRGLLAVAAALVTIHLSGSAFGLSWWTGNEFLEMCRSQLVTPMYGTCVGYVAAVSEATPWMYDAQTPNIPKVCYPKGATLIQLVDVVVQYLEENPAKRHQPALVSVYLAFALAFRCE